MWFEIKHRNWALFCTFVCVLRGAFGLGDDADERLFRNRVRGSRGGCGYSQVHQVLDSVHEDVLAASTNSVGPGAGSDDLHAANRVEDTGFHPSLDLAECVHRSQERECALWNRHQHPGRAPPVFFL